MRIQAWQDPNEENPGLRPPVQAEDVNKFVVWDDAGYPIAIFTQMTPDHIYWVRAGEPDFEEAAHKLGINKTYPKVVNLPGVKL